MGSAVGSLIPPGARSFGKYELLARLAVGGMAEIFLARRRGGAADSGMVVIKRVLPHLAEDARFVAMFRDEARLASRIEHVNVCRVLELGSVGDTYFIAMEYLHGVPLSRVLLRSARTSEQLDIRFIAAVIAQSCAGLHHAHELRAPDGRLLEVVHRDVSPPNIFVTAEGQVKLLDFGVAKARGASQKTRTGTVKGKNAYMSPEQVLGDPVDRRSDLFSLGIVMWESLTASRLFLRDSDFETFRSITKGPIQDVRELRPEIPAELAAVVRCALERDPAKRYSTAAELGKAVVAGVESIDGPADEKEIARYLHVHFNKELSAKQELLEAASSPDASRLQRLAPASLDLLGSDGAAAEESGVGDDDITQARRGPSRAALGVGAAQPAPPARREVTNPMHGGVARFDSEPPLAAVADGGDPTEPIEPYQFEQEAAIAEPVPRPETSPPETETGSRRMTPWAPAPPVIEDPAAVTPATPEPIEPARTESVRRPNRWRGTPPWLPALALVFAGVCGLAALLYWLL